MKTRGIVDFYLPTPIAYHFRLVLGSLLATVIFHVIKGKDLFDPQAPMIFLLIFVQLEIFIWMGYKFFNIPLAATAKEYLKKVIVRLALFYILVMFISIVILVLMLLGQAILSGQEMNTLVSTLIHGELRGFLSSYAGGVLFGTIFFLYFQWTDALNRIQKLREEKLIYRYETLKNQVRPHFLFNSLNTLSALVQDNEAAERFIQKLSTIYRYILENSEHESVELEKELEFVKDYFYLQQIRGEDKIFLRIDSFDSGGLRIIPISLQILVENAIKHNAFTHDHPLEIAITMEENDYIIVKNNLQKKTILERSSGIGLKNLAERIQLSTGKELIIWETADEYLVKVPLIRLK